jgi:hypothetical protein
MRSLSSTIIERSEVLMEKKNFSYACGLPQLASGSQASTRCTLGKFVTRD